MPDVSDMMPRRRRKPRRSGPQRPLAEALDLKTYMTLPELLAAVPEKTSLTQVRKLIAKWGSHLTPEGIDAAIERSGRGFKDVSEPEQLTLT